MANLRNAILVAVLAATAIAAIAGYFLGGPPSRLLVDAGLAVALGMIISLMLSPTVARVDILVEALRALARGDRHQRVNADDFAGLAEVARAMNEVGASLTEGEDPNLGPVKAQPHPTFRPRPPVERPRPTLEEPDLSEHPELGPVRVLKKKEQPAETTMGAAMSEAIATANEKKARAAEKPASSPPEAPKAERLSKSERRAAEKAEKAEKAAAEAAAAEKAAADKAAAQKAEADGTDSAASAASADARSKAAAPASTPPATSTPPDVSRPEKAAPNNDTAIDDAPASGNGNGNASGNGDGEELAQIPSRAELEALFQEFVAAKKSHEENVADLELDAFAQTIQGECERLIVAHRCKGVRFEVTVQDGEVSLRPRLLR